VDAFKRTRSARFGGRYLLDRAADPVAVVVDGRVASANGALASLLDIDRHRLVGRRFAEFVAPDHRERLQARQVLESNGPWPAGERLRVRTATGTTHPAHVTSLPVLWAGRLASQLTILPVDGGLAGSPPAEPPELLAAIGDGQIEVHYQPVVWLRTGTVLKVEALARWRHPERGLLGPAEFVAAAELDGSITELGREVLRVATAQVQQWRADRQPGLELTVNLSAHELGDPSVVDQMASALAATELPPQALWVEVTETALVRDLTGAVERLTALRELGVRLAIDDFGTGYANLTNLRQLPVDAIKIDRTFVAGLGRDGDDTAIVRNTLNLARELGLLVIAEGIETSAQQQTLLELGAEMGQGYHFSHPVPAPELAGLLTRSVAPAPRLGGDDDDERVRLEALHRTGLLDTGPEADFDDVVRLTARLLDVPISLVSLVDAEKQWFKARVGLELAHTPRRWSFCAHALERPGEVLVVNDAAADPRFVDNPLVTGPPNVRFYAGAPLTTDDGAVIGTLCVLDRRPRSLTADQLDGLRRLARHVSSLVRLRTAGAALAREVEARAVAEDAAADRDGGTRPWSTTTRTSSSCWPSTAWCSMPTRRCPTSSAIPPATGPAAASWTWSSPRTDQRPERCCAGPHPGPARSRRPPSAFGTGIGAPPARGHRHLLRRAERATAAARGPRRHRGPPGAAPLEHQAYHDGLTGLANRRRFMDELARRDQGYGILYLDLEDLDEVSTSLGRAAGDEILQAVARRVERTVKSTDLVARLGVDEFAVLLAGQPPVTDIAARVGDAVRRPIAVNGSLVEVAASIGHVTVQPGMAPSVALATAADELQRGRSGRS
jgi:diguanylate cyclase (GGDEF)-like protein/PAS domain S-box-containing protein